MSPPPIKKASRGLQEIIDPPVPGKVMEQILLGTIMCLGKHGFTKGKSCLKKLIAFYSKIICFSDVGQVMDIAYLDFYEAFDTLYHSLLLEKLTRFGLHKWSMWK